MLIQFEFLYMYQAILPRSLKHNYNYISYVQKNSNFTTIILPCIMFYV